MDRRTKNHVKRKYFIEWKGKDVNNEEDNV